MAKVVDPNDAAMHTKEGLSWRNVSFVLESKSGTRDILKNVSGDSSTFTAIMGPSGAGKSTLMNILAGRVRTKGNIRVSGSIAFDGVVVDPTKFRKNIAYVMQEDAVTPFSTPRETFHFSAALRLGNISKESRTKKVDELIRELRLEKCADTIVGNVMVKGISGGEKKRTAIGIELISNPNILFLDEPTSGLDSFAAYQVVQILSRLSESGRTILCTIHQPSSEVFSVFDDALLLANGELVYHDKREEMVNYFSQLGHSCPNNYNPADYVMFLMQEADETEMGKLVNAWGARSKNDLEGGRSKRDSLEKDTKSNSSKLKLNDFQVVERVGFFTEIRWLAYREMKTLQRDKIAMIAQIGTTLFLYTIISNIFYKAAAYEELGEKNIVGQGDNSIVLAEVLKFTNSHFGIATFLVTSAMFGLAQPTLLSFPQERPIFLREYASGVYGATSYFLSKLMVEVPKTFMVCGIIFLVCYWLVGFQSSFFGLVLITALFGLVASSVALLIGSLSRNVEVGIQLTPLLFVPQLLFAGFYIPINEIPEWLSWAQYLCSLKYDVKYYNEAIYGCEQVDYDKHECLAGQNINEIGLYPKIEVKPSDFWLYVLILGTMAFSCLISPFLVRKFGELIIFRMCGFALCLMNLTAAIANNNPDFIPFMYPVAAFLGLCSSPMWVAEGSFLNKCFLPENRGDGHGFFFGVFALNNIWAFGIQLLFEIVELETSLLLWTYFCIQCIAFITFWFVKNPPNPIVASEKKEENEFSITDQAKQTLAMFQDKFILISPLACWAGYTEGFFWGTVAQAMSGKLMPSLFILCGTVSLISTKMLGRLSDRIGRFNVLIVLLPLAIVGVICAGVALSESEDNSGSTFSGILFAFAMTIFGLTDLPIQSIMRAIIGNIYKESVSQIEAAFSAMMMSLITFSAGAFVSGRFLSKWTQVFMLLFLTVLAIVCLFFIPKDLLLDVEKEESTDVELKKMKKAKEEDQRVNIV
eukprot:g2942.t1